jgi:hypothetical protein
MRLLLFALLALGAYGQRGFQPGTRFPPDIVSPEVFARRDPLKIDPKHYHLDFENEHVRAIRLTLKADEAVPMHDDVDALAVCIQECHLRFTGRTATSRTSTWKAAKRAGFMAIHTPPRT